MRNKGIMCVIYLAHKPSVSSSFFYDDDFVCIFLFIRLSVFIHNKTLTFNRF